MGRRVNPPEEKRRARIVGKRIRTWREQGGIKAETLAKTAGIGLRQYGRIEDGFPSTLGRLERIAKGLGRSLSDLVADEDMVVKAS